MTVGREWARELAPDDSGAVPSAATDPKGEYQNQATNLTSRVDSTMRLRYYADADHRGWHNHTLRLLKELHDDHDMTVEIDRIDEQHGPITDFPSKVRTSTPEEVYERDLKRNSNLNQSINPTPSEGFKRYGKLDIAGNVSVVDDDGTVQWASTLPGYADGYGLGAESQTAMDFLDDIAMSPSNRICVECLHLLDGDESFCPSCGHDLS